MSCRNLVVWREREKKKIEKLRGFLVSQFWKQSKSFLLRFFLSLIGSFTLYVFDINPPCLEALKDPQGEDESKKERKKKDPVGS